MNIAIRKLAMLEETIAKKEEEALITGYTSCPIDQEFKKSITNVMDKVRCIIW